MAVNAIQSQIINYQPASRGLVYQTQGPWTNLRLVDKFQDQSRANALKAAFDVQMQRALLNQKYWDELLEKLRKMGGGGGGSDTRFDRIAVSMQLMNFLSSKIIQAMIRNFNEEFLKLTNNVLNQIQKSNQNVFVASLQKIGNAFINGLTNMFSLITHCRDAINRVSTTITMYTSAFAGILSFQLNKLKELIKGFDVKGKIKKIKNAILDFFVEMKEEILNMVDSLLRIFNFRVT